MRTETPAGDVYLAIADPTRRALLLRLAEEGERSVNQLLEPLPISQPAVSKHLRILREAGLARARKEGRRRLYSIEPDRLRREFDWVAHFERLWDAKLGALGDYLDAKATRRN